MLTLKYGVSSVTVIVCVDNFKISYIEVKSEVKITMSDSAERSVKIPIFEGTLDSWTTLEPRFIATADLKGYGEFLTSDYVLTTDSGHIVEFKKKKRKAYNGLLLENETRELIYLIKAAKAVEYPRGDARKAFLAL